MADERSGAGPAGGPFRPSLVDRLNRWASKSTARAWVFYAALALGLILVQILVLWWTGGLGATELLPVVVFNGLATPFLLALLRLLDRQASAALDSVRGVFVSPELEFASLRYRLSTMPALPALLAGLLATAGTVLTELVAVVPSAYAALEQLPTFAVVFQIVDKSSAFLFGVFIYHTIRQLRLVNAINAHHIRVGLFHTRPLRAFSGLTATTAVGLLGFVYPWMLINPEILEDPLILAYVAVFTLLAIAVFVWPLHGMHRRIEAEKSQALHQIDQQFEAAFAMFAEQLRKGDAAGLDRFNATIASLETQHRTVEAIPTWPWRPETGRLVLTAIALPLVLIVLQTFVERALR